MVLGAVVLTGWSRALERNDQKQNDQKQNQALKENCA